MNINQQNLAAWLQRACSKQLTAAEEQALLNMLEQHPEWLDGNPEALRWLPDEADILPNRERFKAKVTEANCDLCYQLAVEGRLKPDYRNHLEKFLEAHPAVHNRLKMYGQVVLHPDPALRFPQRSRLYRRPKAVVPLWSRLAAAAAAAVLALAWLLNDLPRQPVAPEVTELLPVISGLPPVPEVMPEEPAHEQRRPTAAIAQASQTTEPATEVQPVETEIADDSELPPLPVPVPQILRDGDAPLRPQVALQPVPQQQPLLHATISAAWLRQADAWLKSLQASAARARQTAQRIIPNQASGPNAVRLVMAIGPLEMDRTFFARTIPADHNY